MKKVKGLYVPWETVNWFIHEFKNIACLVCRPNVRDRLQSLVDKFYDTINDIEENGNNRSK